jgi:uncharacterized protein (TIGR02246 family)
MLGHAAVLFLTTALLVPQLSAASLRGEPASEPGDGVQDPGKAKEEVTQVEQDWAAAMSRRDAAALQTLLADDIRWVENGRVKQKAEIDLGFSKWPKTPAVARPCNEVIDQIDVQLFGEVAVATGQYTTTCKEGSKQEKGSTVFADVLVRRGGRWQFVLMTNDPVPDEKKYETK